MEQWCLKTIPDEILIEIFEFSDEDDLLNSISLVDHRWNFYSNSEKLWKQRCLQHSGLAHQNLENMLNFQYKSDILHIQEKSKTLQYKKLFQQLVPVSSHFQFSTEFTENIKIDKERIIKMDCRYEIDRIVRTISPIPLNSLLFYFEMKILKCFQNVNSIGLIHEQYNLKRQPGWSAGSVGYHGDDGRIFVVDSHGDSSNSYGKNDVIGCGFHKPSSTVFFTKNGKFNGHICKTEISKLYPCIGMWNKCEIEVNFGQKNWEFNLEIQCHDHFTKFTIEDPSEEQEDEVRMEIAFDEFMRNLRRDNQNVEMEE
jgi:hypothetical protein